MSTDRQLANRETAGPDSPPIWRRCLVGLAVYPLRNICPGTRGPDFPTGPPYPPPTDFPPLSPATSSSAQRPWERSQRPARVGGRTGCVCAHLCARRHAPHAREPSDPRQAPAPVTWYQSYLGNWPFWLRVNWGVKPLGFVKKRIVREMLCHLV